MSSELRQRYDRMGDPFPDNSHIDPRFNPTITPQRGIPLRTILTAVFLSCVGLIGVRYPRFIFLSQLSHVSCY